MGANTSSPATPSDSTAKKVTTPDTGQTTSLYKYQAGPRGGSGNWELFDGNVQPTFFNSNEDSRSATPEWHVEAGDLETKVTEEFNADIKSRRVVLAAPDGSIWALRFPSEAQFSHFVDRYNGHLFSNTYGMANDSESRDKVFGSDSILNVGAQETDESRQLWIQDMDVDEKPEEAERLKDKQVRSSEEDTIFGVRMGAGDRSYLVRDKKIEVLRNVRGGVEATGMSFQVTPTKGTSFTPNKTLLMNRERYLAALSPDRRDRLYDIDIERGQVINEWKLEKDGVDVSLTDIANQTRDSQLDDRSTFLGLGPKRLALFDKRDPRGEVQELLSPSLVKYVGGHDYKTNTRFSCMATSGDGYVVIGSEDGQLRLYSDRSLSRANTAVPGLGAPITSVDVTFDGKWVLATTDKYLMVVKTTYKDKTGKETNGFKSRMGARGPAPRLLRLKVEDTVLTKGAPLAKGKFTWITQTGREERWIVANCGNYTVLWNFRQVKLAQPDTVSFGNFTTCTSYHLIPKDESVVDSVFVADKYASPGGNDAAMVIATRHKIHTVAEDDD